MARFLGTTDFRHDGAERIGVLLVNSGTPDSTSTRDVRRFLRNLLSDPRVVELPRWLWLPLLHGVILRTRPMRSARKYRRVVTRDGLPLLTFSEALRRDLAHAMGRRVIAPLAIELGMLYSRPSIDAALMRLVEEGARRILVVPLFPQYCAVTTGAMHDQVGATLARLRWLPEVRYVNEYADHPAYIEALRDSIAQHWEQHGRTRHLLLSFHGIPAAYFRRGDPYYCKCQKSARLLADELGLAEGEWSVAFQSKFGPGRWLEPYTANALETLAARGIDSVTVACPGFPIDCLETLEEIAIEGRARFLAAGGRKFEYVPALNDRPGHVRLFGELIAQHTAGWTSAVALGATQPAPTASRAPRA
jgi:ferrochelatase